MKRIKLLLTLLLGGLVCLSFWAQSAGAQQPADQAQPPRPAKPRAQPQLPTGHPPINPRANPRTLPKGKPIPRDPSRDARFQKALDAAKARAQPKTKKFPVDAHGYCIGQGPKDRPKDINLMHGWLGVDNEKAEPVPRRTPGCADGDNEGWFCGTMQEWGVPWAWWQWRITPYMWRYENHEDHCDPRNQPIPLLANIINLSALIFLIVRFGRKPLVAALKKRRSDIMSEIDKAREIRNNAQKRLARYEDDLDHLDERLDGLRAQYAEEGAKDKQRLIADMGATRDRMMDDADFRISQESKSARNNLSRTALDGALGAAEALLVREVDQADHDRLAEEYLDQIGPALQKRAVDDQRGASQ